MNLNTKLFGNNKGVHVKYQKNLEESIYDYNHHQLSIDAESLHDIKHILSEVSQETDDESPFIIAYFKAFYQRDMSKVKFNNTHKTLYS